MKKLEIVSLLALAVFALIAFKTETTKTRNTTPQSNLVEKKADAKNLKLAFVTNNASDFWIIAQKE